MKRILIANDEVKALVEKVREYSRGEFEVTGARACEELLALHGGAPADLVIADLHMEGMNGDEMCVLVKNDDRYRSVPVILLCTSRKADLARCVNAGADSYLEKPVDPLKLIDKMNKFFYEPVRRGFRVIVKASVEGMFVNETFFGVTDNISVSGMLFEADKVLAKGDVIKCTIIIPDFENITAHGEVKRVFKKSHERYKYGVEFKDLSDDDREVISAFVKSKTEEIFGAKDASPEGAGASP